MRCYLYRVAGVLDIYIAYINMLIHVRVGLDIETSVESIIHESQIYRKRFLASAVPSI